MNTKCKHDLKTFSINAKLQEINAKQIPESVPTWIDFDQNSLSISFCTTNVSLMEKKAESVRIKLVFIEEYDNIKM